jgi:hypothetical protein
VCVGGGGRINISTAIALLRCARAVHLWGSMRLGAAMGHQQVVNGDRSPPLLRVRHCRVSGNVCVCVYVCVCVGGCVCVWVGVCVCVCVWVCVCVGVWVWVYMCVFVFVSMDVTVKMGPCGARHAAGSSGIPLGGLGELGWCVRCAVSSM